MPRRLLLAGIAAGLTAAGLTIGGMLEPMDLDLYDRLFEWRGPRPPRTPIVIVAIDDASVREIDRWPLPRAMHARIIDRVSAGKPLAIGIDVVFDTRSGLGPEDDAALNDAVARARTVVLAAAPVTEDLGFAETFAMNMPIKEVRGGARHVGHVTNPRDRDGGLRQALIMSPPVYQGVPAFVTAVHDVARGAGMSVMQLPDVPAVRTNFHGGPKTFESISFYRVLRGEVGVDIFRSKIVLIGATGLLMHDRVRTPFARNGDMPGVEFLANVIATLIQGDRIREVPSSVSAFFAGVVGVAMALLVARRPRLALPAALCSGLVIVATTYLLFLSLHVWFRPVGLLAAVTLGTLFALAALQSLPRSVEV